MRFLLFIFAFCCTGAAVAAQSETRAQAMSTAMAEMRAENWRAATLAAAPVGDIARDVIEWHRLRKGGQAPFDAYRDFLERRSDWPGLALLRTRGEGSIPEDAAPQEVLDYFEDRLPETGTGVLRLVNAYQALGQDGDAEAIVVQAWRTRTLSAETESALLDSYASLLEPHHTARLDDLLWRGQYKTARRMYSRVPEGWQKLAEARIALAQQDPGVDTRIAAVPENLAGDPGLAYERFNWRARKGRGDDAIALVLALSNKPESLGRPEKWANWRRIYARRMMREGQTDKAYALASRHFIIEGSNFADLEWLSGYLALRYLEDPELALLHFDRFASAVKTPISLGRAGYWQGRAYAEMGDTEAANLAFAEGAKYQSSFYGLLSAEAAGVPLDPTLTGNETFPPFSESSFRDSSVLAAGLLLLEAGELSLAERFLTHLTESLDRQNAGSLGALMIQMNESHLAVMVGKRAASFGNVIPAAYFPMSPLMERDLPVPKEFALSIARRESEFDPVVVSPVGARGLMQVMPGTAKDVASELEIPYDRDALTQDPAYNVTLGSAYLAGLIEVFGPAPILVSVGYNAGPGRSLDWVSRFGDPRSAGLDVVDWIEHIPFRETRNYAMRVSESVRIYRARLSGETGPVDFLDFLKNG